jgi:hypothetical protein
LPVVPNCPNPTGSRSLRGPRAVDICSHAPALPFMKRSRSHVLEIYVAVNDRGWKREFEDPILRPRGRQLVTLKYAANYIMNLPKAEQNLPEWQFA